MPLTVIKLNSSPIVFHARILCGMRLILSIISFTLYHYKQVSNSDDILITNWNVAGGAIVGAHAVKVNNLFQYSGAYLPISLLFHTKWCSFEVHFRTLATWRVDAASILVSDSLLYDSGSCIHQSLPHAIKNFVDKSK